MKKLEIISEEYCVKNKKLMEGKFVLSNRTIIYFIAEDYYYNQWGAPNEELAFTIDRLSEIHRMEFGHSLH